MCKRRAGPPPIPRGRHREAQSVQFTHTRARHIAVCYQNERKLATIVCFHFLSGVCLRPRRGARKRPCSASTSQRSTGATTVVASARPSRPARASQTAVATRRLSSSALGKYCILLSPFPCPIFLNKCWMCARCPGTRLSEDRVGDICNACVLLVKRWKKLPNGSKKNWNHVSLFFPYHSFPSLMLCQLIECGTPLRL